MGHMTSYLVLSDLKSARDRSATRALAAGCDGVHTKYWWECVPLQSGQGAVIVMASGPYATSGLTATEISGLQSTVQIATSVTGSV